MGQQNGHSTVAVKNENVNKEQSKGSKLEKFFVDQLKDMYWSEKHLMEAIPKMEKASTTEQLKEAFADHLHVTGKHVKRLEKVFDIFGQKPEAQKCEAMTGLVKEAEKIISETDEGSLTRDAALIIAAQKAEHYEIASYGGLVELARTMQQHEAADILERTLNEEEEADDHLTYVAEAFINVGAEEEGNYSWSNKQSQYASSLG